MSDCWSRGPGFRTTSCHLKTLFTPLYMCLCSPHFTCVFVHPTLHVSLFTPLYMCLCSPHVTCVFVHPTLHVSLFTPLYMCLCLPNFTCVFVHPTLHVSLFTPLSKEPKSCWCLLPGRDRGSKLKDPTQENFKNLSWTHI